MGSISLAKLSLDADTQARVSIDETTVQQYVDVINDNKSWVMGQVVIFQDGSNHFIGDGWHRALAASKCGRKSIPAEIRPGDALDALLFGMKANDKHGLRMSTADKRRCVEYLLDNGLRGKKLKQSDIADLAGVNVRTVKRIVADRKDIDSGNNEDPFDVDETEGDNVPSDDSTDAIASEPEPDPRDEAKKILSRMEETAARLMQMVDEVGEEFSGVHYDKSVINAKALVNSLSKWKRSL